MFFPQSCSSFYKTAFQIKFEVLVILVSKSSNDSTVMWFTENCSRMALVTATEIKTATRPRLAFNEGA